MTVHQNISPQFVLSCIFAFVLFLAACTGETLVNPRVPPPGSSAAFSDGYVEGCLSGFRDANRTGYEHSYTKDETRYAIDADYKAGWDQGHAACYLEELRHPRVTGEGANFR